MLKYIPFYPHDFFNDPRILQLEPREQQQWLFLLARMMLTEAAIPENYRLVGRTLYVSSATAQKLIAKLKTIGLLVTSPTGEHFSELTSPRLTREYEQAKLHCQKVKDKAKAAADKRWRPKTEADNEEY